MSDETFASSGDAKRIVRLASDLVSAGQPDGLEGPRAIVLARALRHPRIRVLVDPVLPGRPNVIAVVAGDGAGPGLLLNAHLDTGHPEHGWRGNPLEPWLENGRLFGAGVSDMLGGLAAMAEALLVVADAQPLPGDVVLLASMYHDSNAVGTKYALASDGEWPQMCVNGEPTELSAVTAHGGCIRFEVEFRGRAVHVSRQDEGADAAAAAVGFAAALRGSELTHRSEARLPGLPRLQIGRVDAGTSPSLVAETAIVQGDIRTVPGMDWETVRRDLKAALEGAAVSGVEAEIRCLVRQRPFIGASDGLVVEVLGRSHEAIRATGLSVDTDRAAQSFVSDAPDLAAAGIETVVYGPGAWHYEPNESVAIDELLDAARIYATAAALITQGQA